MVLVARDHAVDGRSHSLHGYEGHTRHRLKVRFDTTARQLCGLDLLKELGQQWTPGKCGRRRGQSDTRATRLNRLFTDECGVSTARRVAG